MYPIESKIGYIINSHILLKLVRVEIVLLRPILLLLMRNLYQVSNSKLSAIIFEKIAINKIQYPVVKSFKNIK